MENVDPKQIYEKLNNRYLDFVVSRTCRDNKKLCEEVSALFGNEGLLFQDLIVQALPEYQFETKDIKLAGFNEKFQEFLRTTTIKKPYVHQFLGWNRINMGKSCIVATGTGSGKTETFMMPILQYCANNAGSGIQVVLIYPLKALAKDQKQRLDKYLLNLNELYGTNITCGIFDGDLTPTQKEEMIKTPPNILITNYVMLERILIDPVYSNIFHDSELKYVVLDEIHYYSGAQGIDVSLLMRRLQYHTSRIQNLENIQYIGTSATLGDYSSNEVLDFLKRLFNYEFTFEDIIQPLYSENYENNPLKKPKKLKEIVGETDLKNSKLRTHAFYRAPPKVYRCLNCGKMSHVPQETCECGSKALFEILTCKNCGEEYYNYKFSKKIVSNARNPGSTITYRSLRRSALQRYSGIDEEYGELIISNKSYENSVNLKMCNNCLTLHGENSEKCISCGGDEFLNIYSIEKSEKQRNLLKSINDKFCPKCNFEGHAHRVIKSIGDLSDEFCSMTLFEELFCEIPMINNKKRLLVFTDNVQRASRFARITEEYHLEKVIRRKLYDKIKEIDKIEFGDLIHLIIKELDKETILEQEYKTQLKIKIYDELLAKGSNVNSLANKNVFKAYLSQNPDFEEYGEDITPLINTFLEKRQVEGYYDLLVNEEETYSQMGFYSDEGLKERIYTNTYGISKNKDLKNIGLGEVHKKEQKIEEILKRLYENQILSRRDEKYFVREIYLDIEKISEISEEEYLREWGECSKIEILRSAVDTGKTDAESRKLIEESFKSKERKSMNFLVATPTLELGIDIGDLNTVGLLYAPPSPAQYVQRIGRGGRSGTSGMGVTYLSKNAVDAHYYEDITNLVLGDIKPPAYSIDLELPLSKSFFSLFIYYLLNETNFAAEIQRDWRKIGVWEESFDSEVKLLWKKYELNFYEFLDAYLKVSHINYEYNGIVDTWIKKFAEHIDFQKIITKRQKRHNMYTGDIYSYFQEAGLLPDYAFGRGGSKLIIKDKSDSKPINIIEGYSLREVCPPSTLDHGKSRYSCERVWNGALKEIAPNYRECENLTCGSGIIYTKDTKNCPICGEKLSQKDKKIYEPKIVEGRYSYVKKPRKVVFKPHVFEIPEKFDSNLKISEVFNCEVGQIFYGVIVGNSKKAAWYCQNCGKISFNDKNEKCCRNPNLVNPATGKLIFGTKFKTRAVVIEVPQGCDKRTLLNALISAMTLEAGCEDGEIDGIENAIPGKLLIFDNVDGGVGFVDVLNKRYSDVLKTAKELCNMDCCQNGCIKCIGGYWRQSDIPMLFKRNILEYFEELEKYPNS
jgi:superfamily II DNA/RNA helicase